MNERSVWVLFPVMHHHSNKHRDTQTRKKAAMLDIFFFRGQFFFAVQEMTRLT